MDWPAGLLLFLGLGLALGEAGIGVRFDNAGLAQTLGLSALVLILAEGGLTTNWVHARSAAPAAVALATAGVAVTILVVAVLTHWLLQFGWRDALLLGAVLAPTDAAAVFSVLRKLPLPPRLAGMLEGESGLNDAPAVLAVTLLSELGSQAPSPVLIAGVVAYQLVAGAAIGAAVGFLGAWGLRKVALPASGLYPIAVLAFIVASYGTASLARASGFLAVYVAAVGARQRAAAARPGHPRLRRGSWLARPDRPVRHARPARIPGPAPSAGPARPDHRRRAHVHCTARRRVRLHRGAADALAAAGIPVVGRAARRGAHRARDNPHEWPGPGRHTPVRPGVHRRHGQRRTPGPHARARSPAAESDTPAEPIGIDVEAAPLEAMHADLLHAQIPPGSRLHGVEIFELRLPAQANVALIVRDNRGFVPQPTTTLQAGDRLLIVASATVREQTERRLRAVSRAGKLAGWLGERGM